MKHMTLEADGPVIELIKEGVVIVTYSGGGNGWTKYIGQPIPSSVPMAHFENKSDIILDANTVAKYYNCGLMVLI